MPRGFESLEVRFERHVRRTDSCWIWEGGANQAGYGQFRIGRSGHGHPVISVHRWSYEHFVGPIPPGAWICHHCDNPSCVRPDHLYAGTAKQNSADAIVRNKRAKKVKFGARKRVLTDDAVRAIRADDRPVWIVAHAFEVSETTVYAVKSRLRKAHVPDVA